MPMSLQLIMGLNSQAQPMSVSTQLMTVTTYPFNASIVSVKFNTAYFNVNAPYASDHKVYHRVDQVHVSHNTAYFSINTAYTSVNTVFYRVVTANASVALPQPNSLVQERCNL